MQHKSLKFYIAWASEQIEIHQIQIWFIMNQTLRDARLNEF